MLFQVLIKLKSKAVVPGDQGGKVFIGYIGIHVAGETGLQAYVTFSGGVWLIGIGGLAFTASNQLAQGKQSENR